MNEWLDQRYRVLFATYGVGGSSRIWRVKDRLAPLLNASKPLFRSDAAYFLLVNFDHMITRPYTGFVPAPTTEFNKEIPAVLTRDELAGRVDRSLDAIITKLEAADEKPVSAHEVLQATHESWETLSEYLVWS